MQDYPSRNVKRYRAILFFTALLFLEAPLLASIGRQKLNADLLAAAQRGDATAVKSLLSKGANANTRSTEGKAPLVLAAEAGSTATVKVLLSAGATVDGKDNEGHTALMLGARTGRPALLQALLSAGADPNATDNSGMSALQFALQGMTVPPYANAFRVAKFLLAKGARINSKDSRGNTALIDVACKPSGYDDLVLLLANGADTKVVGMSGSPLTCAARNWRLDMVRALISRDADPNLRDDFDETPLFAVINSDSGRHSSRYWRDGIKIVDYLIASGARVDDRNKSGRTVLFAADGDHSYGHDRSYEDYRDLVTLLLDNGADVNVRDVNGKTPLVDMLSHDLPIYVQEKLELLLERGANVSIADNFGCTPLMYALNSVCPPDSSLHVRYTPPRLVSMLLEKGADVKSRDRWNRTALLAAIENENDEVVGTVRTLIALGAGVNDVDHQSRTPLLIAAKNHLCQTMKVLLDSGARTDVTDPETGQSPLHYAADWNGYEGGIDCVGPLLADSVHVDVNFRNVSGWTPLMAAAAREKGVDAVRLLLSRHANPNLKDKYGGTALMYARTGEVVALLQAAGADPEVRDDEGQSILMHAAEYPDAFRALIKERPDLRIRDLEGRVLLHHAAEWDAEEVKILLAMGADVNARDNAGETPLMHSRSAEIAELLKDAGAEMRARDNNGMTILMHAAKWPDAFRALIKEPPDLGIRDLEGRTLLHYAAEWDTEEVKILLARGAEVDARDNQGRTPLMLAVEGRWAHAETVRVLLAAGADPNARDNKGRAPLRLAAEAWDNAELVKALLIAGAKVNATDLNGETAMMHAAGRDIARALQQAGADMSARDNEGLTVQMHVTEYPQTFLMLVENSPDLTTRDRHGATLLHYAAASDAMNYNYNSDEVKTLLAKGADLNVRDNEGRTPLMIAAEKGRFDQPLESLIAAGADVNARDREGRTPLMAAAKGSVFDDSITKLLAAGADVNATDQYGQTAALYSTSHWVLETLIHAGANLKAKGGDENTLLLHAAKMPGAGHVIAYLFDNGADVNSKDLQGLSLLHWALSAESLVAGTENVEALLSKHADVNARDSSGMTPLMVGVSQEHNLEMIFAREEKAHRIGRRVFAADARTIVEKVLKLLLDAGADVNAKDDSGRTVLIIAVQTNLNLESVKLLLAAGADVNAKTNGGRTAIMEAADRKDLADLLKIAAARQLKH